MLHTNGLGTETLSLILVSRLHWLSLAEHARGLSGGCGESDAVPGGVEAASWVLLSRLDWLIVLLGGLGADDHLRARGLSRGCRDILLGQVVVVLGLLARGLSTWNDLLLPWASQGHVDVDDNAQRSEDAERDDGVQEED